MVGWLGLELDHRLGGGGAQLKFLIISNTLLCDRCTLCTDTRTRKIYEMNILTTRGGDRGGGGRRRIKIKTERGVANR